MQLLKILVFVLALAAVAFTAKVALTGTASVETAAGPSEPKRQLDSVRGRASELERELQRNADRADVAR
jgi:hypothetical protein